jgi:proline- and glutamine-rich splicing factor
MYPVILGRCRLYFGNIPQNFTEKQVMELIRPYGESDDVYISDKKSFGFVKMVLLHFLHVYKNVPEVFAT